MILTQATQFGPQYHYCRTCKRELGEIIGFILPVTGPIYKMEGRSGHEEKISSGAWQYATNRVKPLSVKPDATLAELLIEARNRILREFEIAMTPSLSTVSGEELDRFANDGGIYREEG